MPSNKRLTVTVEVWHNRSPHVRSAVADKIQTKHQNLWNGWNNDDYPWTLAMPDPEDDPVEDDSRFYVQLRFKNNILKENDPEPTKRAVIHDLCNKLLGSESDSPEKFARLSTIPGELIQWKPWARAHKNPLSWVDHCFAIAFCIRFFELDQHVHMAPQDDTRNQAMASQSSKHSIIFMSDIEVWFPSEIQHAGALFEPVGGNASNTVRGREVFLNCLRFSAQFNKWADMAAHALVDVDTTPNQDELEIAVNETIMTLQKASTKVLAILDELRDGEIEIRSPEDLKEASQELHTLWQHALLARRDSYTLSMSKKNSAMRWGLGAGGSLIATGAIAAIAFILSFSLTAPVVIAAMVPTGGSTIVCGVRALFKTRKYFKNKKVTKSIYDVGAVAHQVWLFMTLYLMRLDGRIDDNNEDFIRFAMDMANTFEGVNVIGDWGDEEYIKEWLKGQSGLMRENLDRIRRT